jgi:hypothetical protein
MNPFGTRLRRLSASLGMAALLLSLFSPGVLATGTAAQRVSRSEVNEPIRLLVELQSIPLADKDDATQVAQLQLEQDGFRSQVRGAGIRFKELHAYRKLFNGLSIQVASKDAGRIASLKGVSRVFIPGKVTGRLPKADLASSVGMIGAPHAWQGDNSKRIPGVDGKGVTVAVIDTGTSVGYRT